jgi:hypothetical protein
LAAAARFDLDQVKKEFNALNKQIAELRKVWRSSSLAHTLQGARRKIATV